MLVIKSVTHSAGTAAGTTRYKGQGPIHTTKSSLIEFAAFSTISNQLLASPLVPVTIWNQLSVEGVPSMLFTCLAGPKPNLIRMRVVVVALRSGQNITCQHGSIPFACAQMSNREQIVIYPCVGVGKG